MIFCLLVEFSRIFAEWKNVYSKNESKSTFQTPLLGGMCENGGELSSSRQTISFIEKRTISCLSM